MSIDETPSNIEEELGKLQIEIRESLTVVSQLKGLKNELSGMVETYNKLTHLTEELEKQTLAKTQTHVDGLQELQNTVDIDFTKMKDEINLEVDSYRAAIAKEVETLSSKLDLDNNTVKIKKIEQQYETLNQKYQRMTILAMCSVVAGAISVLFMIYWFFQSR